MFRAQVIFAEKHFEEISKLFAFLFINLKLYLVLFSLTIDHDNKDTLRKLYVKSPSYEKLNLRYLPHFFLF